MELANHSYQEDIVVNGGTRSADVIASRKSSLTNNFSYPRPDRHFRRHESSESRSSLTSNGSMPGMTDTSDSETSFDEDSNYNTSASELWDSFWPDNAIAPGEQYPVLLRASQTPNYFTKSFPKHESQETDDTITLSKLEPDSKTSGSSCGTLVPQPSPPRPATRSGAPTYSVYPKLEPPRHLQIPLPPRTSSLSTAPLSPPRRQVLKPSKSNTYLKQSKSSHNLKHHKAMPPVARAPMSSMTTQSVPVSPAYPPPPPPRALRSAASDFNLRDKRNSNIRFQQNTTIPPSPLSPATATSSSGPQPAPRPELERYVSVFEIDSDHESFVESNSFTKRIARGFHKKSASEKRSRIERQGSEDSDSQNSEKSKDSSSRKRGGSLGRILGLRSR